MTRNEEIFPMENAAEQARGSRRIRKLGMAAVVLGVGILIGAEATHQLLSSPLNELLGTSALLAGGVVILGESNLLNRHPEAVETRQHAEAEV